MRAILIGTVLTTLASGAVAKAPAEPPEAIQVTSDTRAYCDALEDRMSRLGGDAEAGRLAEEGAAMCRHGQVRGGIIRLRRALILAHGPKLQSN